MTPRPLVAALLLACSTGLPAGVEAQDKAAQNQTAPQGRTAPQNQTATAGKGGFAFVPPPSIGAPTQRIGAASRGAQGEGGAVSVLAPAEGGLTLEAAPVLYFQVPRGAARPVTLVLVADGMPDPVLDVTLPGAKPGINRLDLKRHGVTLEPGRRYEWSVEIVADPAQPSLNSFATGAVKRVAPPADLAAGLRKAATPREKARLLAAHGIWYDTLDLVSSGDDPGLRAARAALLDQAGLGGMADVADAS